MIIQDYFQAKMDGITNPNPNIDLESEAVSKILNKSKEEVTELEKSLLTDIFLNGTYSPRGNNYTDERFKEELKNVQYYLDQGEDYDTAFAKRSIPPEPVIEQPEVERNDYVQDYFVRVWGMPQSGYFSLHDPNYAREVISKILDVNEDLVTEEQIRLLDYLTDSLTMHYDGIRCNNFTDDDFRERLLNMSKHMENGLDIDRAVAEAWRSPEELAERMNELNSVQPVQEERNPIVNEQFMAEQNIESSVAKDLSGSKLNEFKNKYASLFDKDGVLKDNAVELLDAILSQYAPQLIKEEKEEKDYSL